MSSGLGDQFKSALNEALTTGNYEELNTLVADTVNSALGEVGATASKAWQQRTSQSGGQGGAGGRAGADGQPGGFGYQYWSSAQQVKDQALRAAQQAREAQALREERLRQRNAMLERQRQQRTGLSVEVKNKGLVAGVLFIVFGAIANIPLFVCSLLGMIFGWDVTGMLLMFLFVSIFFICNGKGKIQLINKAKRYVKLCGEKMFAEVEELAARVGMSTRKVEKELRKILQKGIIPSAHIDKKGTHLMLNDTVYKQYVDAEKSRLLREKEQKEQARVQMQKPQAAPTEEAVQQQTELEQMVSEGQAYIKKLREMNDLIPGEVISSKLYRLEDLLKEIFQRVQKEPAQMNRMHKLMSYYLPTTLKLVEAYHEFDKISSPGEEIISAKKEIEATLDTINDAFVELLNSLFQDKVFDITTDAQVLQTMLASEGLTKEMDMMKVTN